MTLTIELLYCHLLVWRRDCAKSTTNFGQLVLL